MAAMIKKTTGALKSRRDTWAPAYGGVGVGLLGEFTRLFDTAPVVATVGATAVGAAFWVRARVPDRLDRLYRYSVLGASTSYVLTMHEVGHPWWQLPALIAGSALLGVPWWRDERKVAQVRLEGNLARWPEVSRRLGMSDASIVGVTIDAIGNHHGRIVWPAGSRTVRTVLGSREALEGALDLPAGSLRLERDGRNSNSVRYHAVITDPHAESVPWRIPTEERDGELYLKEVSVLDPITLGPRDDGTPKQLRMFVKDWGSRQLLAAGTKGSGKSGLVNLLVGTYACARDAVQWGIDLKGGMELGPWSKVFDWMVTDYDAALRMLVAAEAVVEARAAYCAARGWRFWKPDRDHPVLAITVDECHSLNGRMNPKDLERLERIANKGRAVGVELREATQYPTEAAIGSTQIREQMDQRFCFRMNSGRGENVIFDGAKTTVGAEFIPADRPGTCYHMDNENLETMPIRVLWVSDETVAQVVELRAGYTTPLDKVSADAAAAAVPEYLDRPVPLSRDEEDGVPEQRDGGTGHRDESRNDGTEDEVVDESDIPDWSGDDDVPINDILRERDRLMSPAEREAAERERDAESRESRDIESRPRLDEREALEAVGTMLREAGPEGVRPKALMEGATRKATWLYDTALPYYRERNQVRRTAHGLWAWAVPTAGVHGE